MQHPAAQALSSSPVYDVGVNTRDEDVNIVSDNVDVADVLPPPMDAELTDHHADVATVLPMTTLAWTWRQRRDNKAPVAGQRKGHVARVEPAPTRDAEVKRDRDRARALLLDTVRPSVQHKVGVLMNFFSIQSFNCAVSEQSLCGSISCPSSQWRYLLPLSLMAHTHTHTHTHECVYSYAHTRTLLSIHTPLTSS